MLGQILVPCSGPSWQNLLIRLNLVEDFKQIIFFLASNHKHNKKHSLKNSSQGSGDLPDFSIETYTCNVPFVMLWVFLVEIITCFIALENGNLRGVVFYCFALLHFYIQSQTYAELTI